MLKRCVEKEWYFDIFYDSKSCCSRNSLNEGSVKWSIVKKKISNICGFKAASTTDYEPYSIWNTLIL